MQSKNEQAQYVDAFFETQSSGIDTAETVPAFAATEFYLIDVSLIYRENLTGLRPAGTIGQTPTLPGQHRTDKEQAAANAALIAAPFPELHLPVNMSFSKMNQEKPPQLANGMKCKTGIATGAGDSGKQTTAKRRHTGGLIKTPVYGLTNRLHILSFFFALVFWGKVRSIIEECINFRSGDPHRKIRIDPV